MLSCFYFNLPSTDWEFQHFPASHRVLGGKEHVMSVELHGHKSQQNILGPVAKEY